MVPVTTTLRPARGPVADVVSFGAAGVVLAEAPLSSSSGEFLDF